MQIRVAQGWPEKLKSDIVLKVVENVIYQLKCLIRIKVLVLICFNSLYTIIYHMQLFKITKQTKTEESKAKTRAKPDLSKV